MDIVGLGLSTVDILLRLGEMPAWDRPSSLSELGLDGGGPVATACVAAARLGAQVGYIGTHGNDRLGEIKLQTLAEQGIDLSQVKRRDQPESQVVLVYVNEKTGERIFTGLRNWNQEPLKPSELDREYITSARFLHLDGTHPEAALQAALWMREAGADALQAEQRFRMVSLDGARSDGRPLSDALVALVQLTDILICSSGFGFSLTGIVDSWQAGKAILEMGPRVVVQTEGKEGSFTVTAGEQFHTPAFDVDVVDTTGAGDVFHGAFLVGWMQGGQLREVVRFASAVAALKCRQLGGRKGIPTMQEATAYLNEHRG
jgi:sugar/nucleoside kinase (ribokinase family)